PQPPGPPFPPIPHDVIEALLDRYLGPRRRAGAGLRELSPELHEQVLARTRFGTPHVMYIPGRADVIRDIDSIVARYYSTSFGAQRAAFEGERRAQLADGSSSGRFWDWPGDTELILARKPVCGPG